MLTKAAFVWSKNCKNSNIVKYYNSNKLFSILIYLNVIYFSDGFSAVITEVFSVTRAFINHSNMLLKRHFYRIIIVTVVLLNIFVETDLLFEGKADGKYICYKICLFKKCCCSYDLHIHKRNTSLLY